MPELETCLYRVDKLCHIEDYFTTDKHHFLVPRATEEILDATEDHECLIVANDKVMTISC